MLGVVRWAKDYVFLIPRTPAVSRGTNPHVRYSYIDLGEPSAKV
jgi:hypothetical protein